MRVAQKFAGYSLAAADNLRKACGRRTGSSLQRAGQVHRGVRATGYGAELGEQWFDIIEPLRTMRSTAAMHSAMATSPTRPHSSRRTTPPSTWRRCSPRSRRTSTRRPSTSPECRTMGISVEVPTSAGPPRRLHPGGRDRRRRRRVLSIVFGLSAVRNVGEGLVAHIVAEARGQRAVRRLLRLLPAGRPRGQQAPGRVADQGQRLRRRRPPRKGLLTVFEQIVDPRWRR